LAQKLMVSGWKSSFNLKTLDLSLYCMGMGRMFRIPNVRRSNGRFKVPLSLDEVMHLSFDEITQLTYAPREIEPVDGPDYDCPDLAEHFRECLQVVHADHRERAATVPIDPIDADKVRGTLTPCVRYILSERFTKPDKATFNNLAMLLTTYFHLVNIKLEDALSACHTFLQTCPSTSYPTFQEKQKQFQSLFDYTDRNPSYQFACRFILGKGFPGSAFECRDCLLKKPEKPDDGPKVEADTDDRLFVHVSQLVDRPTRYLIKNVLEADCLAELFGAPGTYKSFVAIQMALSVASGKDFFGYPVKDTGPVMFLIGEGLSGFKRRLRAWGIHNQIDINTLPVFVSKRPAELTVKSSVECIITGIEQALLEPKVTPKVLVVDTLARNFGPADENNTGDMGRFVDGCTAIRQKYGTTILIVHHCGVIDKTRGRGNSALYAGIDYCYRMDRTEGEKNASLVFLKAKDAELQKPINIQPVVIRVGIDDDGEPVTSLTLELSDDEGWDFENEKSQPRRIGAKEKLMRDILIRLFVERVAAGVERAACIPEKEWRDECKRAGISRKNLCDNLSKFVVSEGGVYALNVT
jgi:hypothetical protein